MTNEFIHNFLSTSGVMLGLLLPFLLFFLISEVNYLLLKLAEIKEERKIRDVLSSSWHIFGMKQPPNPKMTTLILRSSIKDYQIEVSGYKEKDFLTATRGDYDK